MLPILVQALLAFSLSHPSQTIELPKTLAEVSGLSMSSKGTLWAIGDEHGTLYELSTKDGEVLQKIEFHKRGDFESLAEVSPNRVVAAKSDGQLFVLDPKQPKDVTSFDMKTGALCDLEAIAWLPAKKRLLVACKNEQMKGGFAIRMLDLETKAFDDKPFAVLAPKALTEWASKHKDAPGMKHAKPRNFGPSDLAVHPKTGELYLLSSTGRMLVVLSADGSLKSVEGLDRDVHRHPEGIAFGADGTLYISNEAAGRHPVIQRYDPGEPKS